MTQALYKAPTSNFGSTSLNGAINDSVQTITLNSTSGLQAPGYLVIDRQDANGNNTPNAREVVKYTGISGSDITGVTRAADGSTARSHSDGALVEPTLTIGMWNDQQDFLAVSLSTVDGSLRPTSTATISSLTGSFLNFTSGASLTRLTGTSLFYSNATLTNLTVTNSLLASGASVVGVFPSGASGSILMSQGNAVVPVFTDASYPWGTYSPTLTNMATGNGTLTARYVSIGKTTIFSFKLLLGSTSSIGTAPSFTLPVAPPAANSLVFPVQLGDTGVAFYAGKAINDSAAQTLNLYVERADGTYVTQSTALSATVPHAWGNTDTVIVVGAYEAA